MRKNNRIKHCLPHVHVSCNTASRTCFPAMRMCMPTCITVFMCCQIFQHTLSSKHPQYYSTMRLGRSLKDRCTKNDAERDILNHMLEQLKNKWNVVRSIVAQRYVVQVPACIVASLCVTHLTSASWSRARHMWRTHYVDILYITCACILLYHCSKCFVRYLTSQYFACTHTCIIHCICYRDICTDMYIHTYVHVYVHVHTSSCYNIL